MPEKKKIVHIIQSLNNGGCENMLLRTLPLLNDFEHKIITLKELGELAPKFASAGIAAETVHCDNLFDIPGFFRLRKLIKEEAPDIIITYLFHADMIGRLFLRPFLSFRAKPRNLIPIIPFLRTTYNHPKYLIARIIERLTKSRVRQYLANSEAVKNFYADTIGVRPEKITVIPNGIDIEYFDSVTSNPELKKSLNIKLNDFVVICVANLHHNKGHKYLLEAFEEVYKNNKNIKLLLIGDEKEREDLKKQITGYSSKESISFLGKRTDVPQLLKISDAFILPTLFEGMSNAIMEAMACGLPVITTDIPENRVLVENNINGLLVPIRDSSALIQTIRKMGENPEIRKRLSEEAKITIKNSFSLEKTAEKWENVLMETIKIERRKL